TLAYKIHHGERVNILLMGYGGGNHDGAYLSDSILVISVQGVDRVAMTSLPRDSYVAMKALANNGEYDGKVNAAYEIPLAKNALGKPAPQYDTGFDGAGKLASKVIGDYLGITIDYWVGVDFTAFKKLVDAVGGVDVNVPTALDDPKYPTDEGYGYQHIHFNTGLQHMDGHRALIYVRERHADNDFGRSRRQQQVTTLIKQKLQKPEVITQLFSLLDALKDNVHTSMSLNDLKVFGSVVGKIDGAGAHHVSIDFSNWQYEATGYDGAYLLMPRDGTMTSLHKFVNAEMIDPAVVAEKARVQFASTYGEASRGLSLAGIYSENMGMLNLNVAGPVTVPVAPASTVVHDYSGGKAAKTAAWMAQYFGGTVVTEDPTGAPAAPDPSPTPGANPVHADVVVTLGRDVARQFDASGPGNAGYQAPFNGYIPNTQPTNPTFKKKTPTPRPSQVAPAPSTQPSVAPSTQPTHKPPKPPPSPKPASPLPGGGSG
ncbi:MAG TPA: LCP family protein, partial [Candidatus Dormibacteraeota bacterium]|nr:LCP family protein [Candidatus Dormibacteraeota bacterium]